MEINMRKIVNINNDWAFSKVQNPDLTTLPIDWENVNVPHCWNAIDGQDGGNDYYRGTCHYVKKLEKSSLPKAEKYFLEICGANSSADVFMDGKNLCHHDGGYSTWRVDITDYLSDESILAIAVDNSPNDFCYPQMADFTFYGGLYRDVVFIEVNEAHFDLLKDGTDAVFVTPHKAGKTRVDLFPVKACGCDVKVVLKDAEGNVVAEGKTAAEAHTTVKLDVVNPHLWHSMEDPYLYTCEATIVKDEEVLDTV